MDRSKEGSHPSSMDGNAGAPTPALPGAQHFPNRTVPGLRQFSLALKHLPLDVEGQTWQFSLEEHHLCSKSPRLKLYCSQPPRDVGEG